MAESQQGRGQHGSLEAELTCPICLGLYQDPVSLSCGHSFCRWCIRKALGSGIRYSTMCCPTCRATVGSLLQSNIELTNIVKAFQTTVFQEQQDEGSDERNADAVLCENCLDRPQPAVKTCLVCDVSLCQAHLSKHNAKASHQEHILVEVGAGEAQERKCSKHGKLLEYYCQKDHKLICAVCYIAGAHNGHRVVTMREERDKVLAGLSNSMMELQKSESDLVTALQELQESENHIKTNNRAVTSQLEELFKDIKPLLKKNRMILSDLEYNEEKQLAGIAKARQEMEKKRAQAQQNLQALQKIKEQPDIFLFFKEWKLVKDRTADLHLNTERVDVQELKLDESMITQCQTLREKLALQVDSLLQDVCDKLAKQKKLRSEA